MRRIEVSGATLEVDDRGAGDPVLLVQTGLTADELRPVAAAAPLAGFRRLVPHRRGYAGSSPATAPGSIVRDARDCQELLAGLGIPRAHVVGLSYSGAVALQLASDAPAAVASLTVIEPPPVHVPSAEEFRAACRRLIGRRHSDGVDAALDEFLGMLMGPDWRARSDELLPGSVEQMDADAATFFDADMPALLAWRFDSADVDRITAPVLHVGGTESGPWFAEVRTQVLGWFPEAEDVRVGGADHGLALTHGREIATAVADFLRRHPLTT